MILLMLLSLASFTGCDKLDRTYLPPPRSKLAGGSPGAISTPIEQQKLDQTIQGTTVRPHISPIFYTPTIPTLGQSGIEPEIGYQTSNVNLSPGSTIPGTFNVPTTTTSYAFTQTTTYAPITCITPDCAIETASQTQFDARPNLVQQQVPKDEQSRIPVIRPGINQPDFFISQQGGSSKIPLQEVTSQYLPSNLPVSQQQGQSKFQPGTVSGTMDELIRQPIQTYLNGRIPQASSEYIQRPSQQTVPQAQTNMYDQTNLQRTLKPQTSIYYNRPDTAQSYFPERTNLPSVKENFLVPSLFNRVPGSKVQEVEKQNISNIPSYSTSTLSPYIERIGTLQIPFNSSQFPSQPLSKDLSMQTSTSTSESNIPSYNYPSSISSSGYSPPEVVKQLDGPIATTVSQLQPTAQFYGIGQPVIFGSGLKERRPVRPQAEFEKNAAILNYKNIVTPEGFSYSFDTENGIHADESGTAIDGVKAQGAFSYTGDDGKLYSIVYSADENGYQPVGDHLPTPPPIPEAILRVIQQSNHDEVSGISDDGSYDDEKYGYKKYQGAMERYKPEEYHPYGPNTTPIRKLVGSNQQMDQGNAGYIKDPTAEVDKSYKQPETFKQSLAKTPNIFRPDIYRSQTQPTISSQASDPERGRFRSDIQKPEQSKYSDNRKFVTDSSRSTDLQPTRYRGQEQDVEPKVELNGIQEDVPEVQYDNEYYEPDQKDGNVRRPLRPQVNINEIIGVNSRVTPESLSTGYTPSTFRPSTKEGYRPLKQKDDKGKQFSDDQGQTYEYQGAAQNNRLNIKPELRKPSIQGKKPLNVEGYAYLPPSPKVELTPNTQLQKVHAKQTQLPSIASTREPVAGQIGYKFTTLRPFMTPNASPSRTALDYDTDEEVSITYPTSEPSQSKSYSGKKNTSITTYKSTNYTRASEDPFTNHDEQALTSRPTLTSNYMSRFNAPETQYQDYETLERTGRPNQYKEYTNSQVYSQGTPQKAFEIPVTQFSGRRDQNIGKPVDRFSDKNVPGQSIQGTFPQKVDATVKPQYYPTQTSKEYQKQYTTPIEYGETDTDGPVSTEYFPTQYEIEGQNNYPQQLQYIQTTTQSDELPTTYRSYIANFDSSTARPGYNISPTKSYTPVRTPSSQQVTQDNTFVLQPTTNEIGVTKITPGLSSRYPVAVEDETKTGESYGKDVFNGDVTGRPSTVTVYKPGEGRKSEGSGVSGGRFDYTKPVSEPTQFVDDADLKPQDKMEGNPIYERDRPVFVQGDRFIPGQTIKDETFSGPKQAPKFDSETGYYY